MYVPCCLESHWQEQFRMAAACAWCPLVVHVSKWLTAPHAVSPTAHLIHTHASRLRAAEDACHCLVGGGEARGLLDPRGVDTRDAKTQVCTPSPTVHECLSRGFRENERGRHLTHSLPSRLLNCAQHGLGTEAPGQEEPAAQPHQRQEGFQGKGEAPRTAVLSGVGAWS